MDDAPIQRDGRWWHPLPGGAWALWDQDANAWQPVDGAPPPPPPPAVPGPHAAGPPLAGTVEAAVTVRRPAAREPVEPREPALAPSRDDTWASVRVATPGAATAAPAVAPANGRFVKIVLGVLVVAGIVGGGLRAGLIGGGPGMPSSDDVAAAFVPVRGFRYGNALPSMEQEIRRAYDERGPGEFGAVEVRSLSPRAGGRDAVVVVAAVEPALAASEVADYASVVELGAGMTTTPVDLHGVDGLELAGPQGSGGVLFVDADGFMFTVAAARLPDARRIAAQLARAHG